MQGKTDIKIRVLLQTKQWLKEIAKHTHRTPGQALDWLVEEKYRELNRISPNHSAMPQGRAELDNHTYKVSPFEK
ncbi:hypothetical protein [Synechocystis sp. LKSZ1]|uniref:hypothetical protein n=1 Tax=Synechocystis sp. LKSZ1 TaxID=3144951 RepID=UPI00336BBF53